MKAVFALLLLSGTCAAQTYTQRGFLETRGTFYPQKSVNDSGRAVGESVFRYEGFYSPLTKLQIAGAIDLRTDTHHQVERDPQLSWQDRETQRPSAAVRRLSATYHSGPVTVELGKQFIRWGKTDIVTPTDRFAPRDFVTVVDNDFMAITAARLNYEKDSNTVEAVWSPRFTPSRMPLVNQRWVPVADVNIRDAGSVFPGGQQAGIRWNHTGAIEYELSAYRGFNHLPSFDVAGPLPGPNPTIALRRFYPKMLMVGGDVAIPNRLFTVKAEAAHFSSDDDRTDDYALYVIQLERQSGEWFFVGGYAGQTLTKHAKLTSANFPADRGFTRTLLGRAGYTIDANRSVALEAAVRENAEGLWVKGDYSQALDQHWRATLNLTLIRGDLDDFLGQYRRNSHALLVIRYSF